jgi:predicted acyl esterase
MAERHVWIPMADGVRLAGVRFAAGATLPAL